jgi:hypothetical protein
MPNTTKHFRRGAARVAVALAFAATAVAATACDSFLDPEPSDVLAPENFYKTSSDAIAAVNGIYEQAKWGHWLSYWYLTDVAGDDIVASPNFGSDGHRFSNYEFDATEGTLWGVWGDMYQVINRSNAVLDRVPGITMDTTLRRRILGEAYFMRAMSYFDLVRFWGDVPLLEHEVASLGQLRVARSPAADVYALIESDLQQAEARLQPSYPTSDVGRPTSGAATALLAKVYLTQRKWTPAAAAAGSLISSGRYALFDNWRDNFRIANEIQNNPNNKEIIFSFNYDPANDPDAGSVHTLFSLPSGYPGGDAYGLMHIPPSVIALFDTTTGRRDERGNHGTFMLSPYVDAMGRTVTWTMPGGPAFAKYLDETNTQNMTTRGWVQQGNDWIVLRYADVLLMYAEAVSEGGTPTAGTALARLNEVRTRAGILATAVTGTALRDSVRLERRREFVFEGQRWFDLSRWEILDAALRAKQAEIITLYPSETTVHGAPSNLFPIPQGERNVNPLLTQNTGWN